MKTTTITGGAGFTGSHTADRFLAEGWDVHIVDNLVTGKPQLCSRARNIFTRSTSGAPRRRSGRCAPMRWYPAAQMDVRKSVADPVFDADTNIIGSLNLFEAVRATPRHASGVRVERRCRVRRRHHAAEC